MTKGIWEDIQNEFDKSYRDYQKRWEQNNFTHQEAKSWIEKGLTPNDYDFAYYLKKDGYQPSDLNQNNLEELRKKCGWKNIHENFSFWKRKNFPQKLQDYKQAHERVNEQWRNFNFSEEEVQQWMNVGAKINDYKFVAWLRSAESYKPELIADYNRLKNGFKHGLV